MKEVNKVIDIDFRATLDPPSFLLQTLSPSVPRCITPKLPLTSSSVALSH